MLINEVSQKVGMTQKAIKLYESKKLLTVARNENGYRNYSDDNIEALNKIKLLRIAGISVSDIKLLFSGVVSESDILEKRKNEILKESGNHYKQIELCEKIMQQYAAHIYSNEGELDEDAAFTDIAPNDILTVGIDIGTTTISGAVFNVTKNSPVDYFNILNAADLDGSHPAFRLQNADLICEKSIKLLNAIIANYPNTKSIGITGQMHGMLYLNENAESVSHFATWQDCRGNKTASSGISYCEEIFNITNRKTATGYGLTTHYYNLKNGLVPKDASKICNITDYLACKLTNNKKIVMHSSIAHSFGLFDLKNNRFDEKALSLLGIDLSILPEITDKSISLGDYNGISVFIPIGDNQASFIGTVSDLESDILVNIGTGSQITTLTESLESPDAALEIRPLINNKHIICYSALSGGASYALLEKFFRSYVERADGVCKSQFDIMNELAQEAYNSNIKPLKTNTFFKGKRHIPDCKGSINDITDTNFTPGNLILSFIYGVCSELYESFSEFTKAKSRIIASGNAVQKNPLFKAVLSDISGKKVDVSQNKEEAAIGAARFSASSLLNI